MKIKLSKIFLTVCCTSAISAVFSLSACSRSEIYLDSSTHNPVLTHAYDANVYTIKSNKSLGNSKVIWDFSDLNTKIDNSYFEIKYINPETNNSIIRVLLIKKYVGQNCQVQINALFKGKKYSTLLQFKNDVINGEGIYNFDSEDLTRLPINILNDEGVTQITSIPNGIQTKYEYLTYMYDYSRSGLSDAKIRAIVEEIVAASDYSFFQPITQAFNDVHWQLAYDFWITHDPTNPNIPLINFNTHWEIIADDPDTNEHVRWLLDRHAINLVLSGVFELQNDDFSAGDDGAIVLAPWYSNNDITWRNNVSNISGMWEAENDVEVPGSEPYFDGDIRGGDYYSYITDSNAIGGVGEDHSYYPTYFSKIVRNIPANNKISIKPQTNLYSDTPTMVNTNSVYANKEETIKYVQANGNWSYNYVDDINREIYLSCNTRFMGDLFGASNNTQTDFIIYNNSGVAINNIFVNKPWIFIDNISWFDGQNDNELNFHYRFDNNYYMEILGQDTTSLTHKFIF